MGQRRGFGLAGWGLALLCAATAALAVPSLASAQGQGKRVMIYTGTTGFRHTDGINGGRPVIQSKLEALGYTVDWEDCNLLGTATTNCNHADKNPRIFTDANLARYDAVVMLNMSWKYAGGNLPGPLLDDPQKNAIIKFVQNGGGIAAIHNATDAGAGQSIWDWWDGGPNSVVGTTMPGHAATNATGNAATVQVSDPNHLSTKDLPDTWTFMDEHYNFLRNVRGDHHVLATFDERTYTPGVNAKGQDHPITWCKLYDGANLDDGTPTRRTYKDGRTWITGMGHFGVRYSENGGDTNLTKMVVGGVRWVAGEGRKTDCSGTVWSNFHRTVLVPDANQPIGIDVAKDGKVYWSEMGQAGVVANQYNSQGAIMMHDQKGPAGNKTVVGTILTRADHGNSEDGVLGFRLQPGFDLSDPSKRNVFVYYSPRPGPGDNWPIVATPAAQVVGYNQISRFTLNADGTSVVPDSERVILKVPKAKIGGTPSGFPGGPVDSGPGHVGGAGLEFDSAGNLYLGIGDDVSPNAPGHGGYTPLDYRSAERWDARKTAANTADLRGKIIRITPKQGTIATGIEPGVAATYDIPEGNLFPVGTPKTRPEIYGMGFRQPFTVHSDPKNPGTIGMGEYCHDASSNGANRSPAGICEWNLVSKAGNFGWPFCMGNNAPENTNYKWNYATGSTTGQQYNCQLDEIPSDINYAPDGQTPVPPTFAGLDTLPKPIPATIWKKYPNTTGGSDPADYGDLTQGGMQPISGPIFRYPSTAGTGAFPRYYDGAWFINNRGSNTGFWKEVRLRKDNNQMLRVQDWLPYNQAGSAVAQQNSLVIGTQFGADGALYMARYPVTCCRNNVTATSTAQIVKITFDAYEETVAPTTTLTLDPAAPGVGRTYSGPVTVKFSSTDAGDPDPSLPMAGIDYTEYRVTLNGDVGVWTKNTNAGLSNPFLSNSVIAEAQGNYVVEYRGVDRGGNTEATKQATFTIMRPVSVDSEVKAIVPSFLGLSVGAGTLGQFTPGLAQTYTGTAAAVVTSSWANAQLQVYDPETVNNGRLVNGTSVIPRALQVMQSSGTLANIGNSTAPRAVATWATPVSNIAATVTFSQSILATDVLASGPYTRTLRFVLTTTTP
jgi:hypothetical protein